MNHCTNRMMRTQSITQAQDPRNCPRTVARLRAGVAARVSPLALFATVVYRFTIMKQGRETHTGATATVNRQDLALADAATYAQTSRYSVEKVFAYMLDVLCTRDLKERRRENTKAHVRTRADTQQSNMQKLRKCEHLHIRLTLLFTEGLAAHSSCLRACSWLAYEIKTHTISYY